MLKELKLDIDRIVLQLFIPGFFALLPYSIIFFRKFPDVNNYLSKSDGLTSALIILLAITTGLILEDFGSLIEKEVWDKMNRSKFPNMDLEWNNYLMLELPKESDLVAQRYLRTILIRMKFELSFSISLFIMIIGLTFLYHEIHYVDSFCTFICVSVIFPFLLGLYVLYESKTSSKLMIETRSKILEATKNKK